MRRKLFALVVLLVVGTVAVSAEVCTATVNVGTISGGAIKVFGVAVDYGNGRIEKQKVRSVTDFVTSMEASGWKLEQMTTFQNILVFLFRK